MVRMLLKDIFCEFCPPLKIIRYDKIDKFQILILSFRMGERHEIPKEWKKRRVSSTKSIYYMGGRPLSVMLK